jgi:regulatory protein
MAGRVRGRTGRGWDAAPPRGRRPVAAESAAESSDSESTDTRSTDSGSTDSGLSGPGLSGFGRSGSGRSGSGRDTKPRDAKAGGSGWRGSGWRGSGANDDQDVDPAERARQICLQQLAVRPRTRTELAAAMRRRGVAADVAAEVLERYDEVGIIDDRAFASAWVSSRHHGKGLARRALADELRRKGIAAELAEEALDELDGEVEANTARELVRRRLRGERGQPEVLFRRLVGMLARKGYPAGLAIRVVREALEERAAADDLAAVTDLAGRLEDDADLIDAEAAAAQAEAEVEDEVEAEVEDESSSVNVIAINGGTRRED